MKRTIALTVVVTLLAGVMVPLVLIASGAVNMAASNEPTAFEESIAKWAVQRSMAVRVSDETSPLPLDRAAISDGLEYYSSMCVQCHGGPGVEPEGFSKGLNPPAPMLGTVATEFKDGELFWIVKHGIRMTGMPAFGKTHKDEDIWKIVAAVKHLPNLSSDQKRKLSAKSSAGHHEGSDCADSYSEEN